ncbi:MULTISPECIES: efflux RND transporter permease subunit [Sphingobium]|uniref:efflux RND transporter permease subunit n=1 Tax=Sphingobium TaxID=165695 RepID=UPI0015EBFE0C|nr:MULTISPECIES: multidrug efflux RND transporter permease subunit [Sphingobium]MCW2362971.1 hydrophobe/amphiphile efflux-1 (HAE1) family protein [Sphingobium sp. B10D3B]MCW2400349.1 hydrophobe/amphiphile efflux-1 (HAE1) family protein [Sphingobium sp. B10D7B]MCW2407327.1 hydrophobe/amphiphile efflux-1 (HAE1) family protein [Sphingobium xanthum]
MRLSRFFIDRPIFAAVIAVVITIIGAISYFFLPVSQYPEVVPPTVTVSAMYPGASAETVAETVASPIEQEINGVENMLYLSSQSTGDGRVVVTVTFKQGTDLDEAQVLVQNRVAIAEPRLPQEVQRLGIVTKKTSPDFLLVVNLISPDGSLNREYISNYAQTRIKDRLARIEGVGDVQLFGSRDLSMRVWIDPRRAAALGLTAGDIVSALRQQNVQVAAGTLGQPPSGGSAFQLNVETQGRFTDPQQFANVVIRTDDQGRQVRVSDVARVELGAEDYGTSAYLGDKDSVIIPVFQMPGSNALAAAEAIKAEMNVLAKDFPQGLEYRIVYNPTEFIQKSIDEVVKTLVEAVILVVLVIIVFLQKWRAALIPVLAIPVSLIGTFAVLAGMGYSINNLSLFGLVLAIGIVVDDAIVVVENVERNLENGMTPLQAARTSMDEVGGALVAIVLVLCAVFVPTLFIGGMSGAFYQQFAITISAATIISLVLSLTLSPAFAALLLRHRHALPEGAPRWRQLTERAGDAFNRGFDRFSARYATLTARLVRQPKKIMAAYVGLIAVTVAALVYTPSGFIPAQDQGYFFTIIQLPPGSSTARTDAAMKKVAERMLPIPGITNAVMLSGFDGASETRNASSSAAYWVLDDFDERAAKGQTIDKLMEEARKATADISEARLMIVKPPLIRGIGSAGGFRLMVQDREGAGYKALEQAAYSVIGPANQTPGLSFVYTFFDTATPRIFADIDREKAQMLGVPPERVFETLQIYLGSAFVNDFNLLGRTYRVTAQADEAFRRTTADIASLQTRSDYNQMVPIGSIATFRDTTGPYRVQRYNLAPAVAIDGDTAPGASSGQALDAMEQLANANLPRGFSHEWTGIAYQQKTAGNTAGLVFGLAVLLVFLVLAAQYESLVMPLAIILIVPMSVLAALVGVNLRGMDNNVLTQIGMIVLVALAAKNAILIVEFARQGEQNGMTTLDAAVHAAGQRLRPILMTSFAFILGAVPLVLATGAGAELRQALGTAVFFGMAGVTIFGLIFTPTFYVVSRALGDRIARLRGRSGGDAVPAPAE